jgi:hypothetical protein
MVEFPTDQIVRSEEPRELDVFDILFAAVALLASTFSGYTTYLGFSYDFPWVAALIMAVVIGLGLLAINFKLRENRLKGQTVLPTLLAFLLFFVFSFISNTNAIYTFFLQRDIVGETQVEAWRNFDAGTARILAALDRNQAAVASEKRKAELNVARENLQRQITDPARPGLGPLAQAHFAEIENILGTEITRLSPPAISAPMSEHEAFAKQLDTLILEIYAKQNESNKARAIAELREKIEKQRKLYESTVIQKNFKSDITNLMHSDLESLNVSAQELVGYDEGVPSINVTADDIGSFQYTWRNFYDGTKLPAIILSIMLSIMLDILAPVLALLLYHRTTEF